MRSVTRSRAVVRAAGEHCSMSMVCSQLVSTSMDNAGGGVRGSRAIPSRELLEAVTDAYKIGTPGEIIDLGGSSNLNLLVDDGVQRLVVRAYRPYVTEDRLNGIHSVRRDLSDAGLPCGGLVSTRDGRPWIRFEGRLIEVEGFIDHDSYMRTWAQLEEGMRLLGRIHSGLEHLTTTSAASSPPFANYVSARDALGQTIRGVRRIRAWGPTPNEKRLAEDAEELARVVSIAEQAFTEPLPSQLVHGDYWDSNVLFSGERLVFVTDWDFMGERCRIDDLALTLFFTCLEHFEHPTSDDQLRRLRRLLDAYDVGSDTPFQRVSGRHFPPPSRASRCGRSVAGWSGWTTTSPRGSTRPRATRRSIGLLALCEASRDGRQHSHSDDQVIAPSDPIADAVTSSH
jgi:Ser/Thr protein kinase RdoA (MazF antagonist)